MNEVTWITGILGSSIAIVAVFFGLVVAFPIYLHHRRKMLEMHGVKNRQIQQLEERLGKLEGRCEKLQDQLIETQTQFADERRQLDRKLSTMLPDVEAGEEKKTVGPERRRNTA